MSNADQPWVGQLSYTKTPPGTEGPELSLDSYLAVALQPTVYGCKNKADVKMNVDNLCEMIDDTMFNPAGVGFTKLIAIPEGSIQGFTDEQAHMDQATYCREIALTIPGPEIDALCAKAKQHQVYIVFQTKITEPDILPDRFFNTAIIISPEGEIILRHIKNVMHFCEGTTTPYDVWDFWSKEVGEDIEKFYPVVKTDIGNLAVAICYETMFPETFRAFSLFGAEVVVKMAIPGPLVMDGTWEASNVYTAFANSFYVVAPNFGPYYTNTSSKHPYDVGGGNSMVVDFFGRIVRQTTSANSSIVPGDIDITKLRHWRASGMSFQVQVRADLWKRIYEKWPDYPKNLYAENDIPHAMDRLEVKQKIAGNMIKDGLITPPRQG